ncbi:TssQ family T6SS-associated lipoprotein [Massilia sp. IC2-477]|uniref:TssQ family T6SS-associated lipoprotein n=1 Tax=unclassified Massilia TaxID=2609279 RepID=UPI001D1303EF|nr:MULTISPECIES: TssQ family T6SS-associated lipoprotein [unclassified Massilia]MCC2958263.1 TssQ family T6SS-associated lipoprotein [Massilia sp. IC2-477]MCC2973530.1 TssQ family T6SS-associated lipoprotein [Massilia sp. IC2-476]
MTPPAPRILRACFLTATVLLGGCAQIKPQIDALFGGREPARSHPRAEERTRPRAERAERYERPAPRPDRSASDRDDIALREGIALYHEGEFNAAIKRLSSADMNGGSVRNRVTALKYTAFSYCVTNRPVPCRQAFERALRLDGAFDLAPGEQGHPLWGPAFAKARQNAGGREGAREASR